MVGRGVVLTVRAEGDGLVARRRGGQGSGLHRWHPQGLVLLLFDSFFDLGADVRDIHSGRDLRCTNMIKIKYLT